MMWIWVAFGAGLALGYFLRRHGSAGIDVNSAERKQMWIREGHL